MEGVTSEKGSETAARQAGFVGLPSETIVVCVSRRDWSARSRKRKGGQKK